jgi:outer membrane protein
MRRVIISALAFAAVLSGQAPAAQTPAPAGSRVAVISVQRAVLETAEIQKAQTELEAKYKPRQEKMQQMQKELADLQAKLQSGKLTPQQEQEITLQGQRKQRDLQRLTEDLQQEVDRERNDILGRSGQRMQNIVEKLAEERGYDVVVDIGNTVYYKPGLDITKDAVAAYDKAHPVK